MLYDYLQNCSLLFYINILPPLPHNILMTAIRFYPTATATDRFYNYSPTVIALYQMGCCLVVSARTSVLFIPQHRLLLLHQLKYLRLGCCRRSKSLLSNHIGSPSIGVVVVGYKRRQRQGWSSDDDWIRSSATGAHNSSGNNLRTACMMPCSDT
jgi:hypothetical protein